MRLSLFAGWILAVALTQPAQADGLIYQLPADGAQVLYDLEMAATLGGQTSGGKGSLTVSSVGKLIENGEPCRWIELKMITPEEGREKMVITKALIPEKYLGKGQSAADHVIRAWQKEGDQEAQLITDFEGHEALSLKAFLAGPPKNISELKKTEIDGKLGKLECAGVTGELEFGVEGHQVRINIENRLHDKAPFGLVNAAWKFELKNDSEVAITGTFKLTLTDTSTTALSQLPDKK